MKRLLLDVNVLLDVLLDRDPWAESASALWAAVESGKSAGIHPAHGVDDGSLPDAQGPRGSAFADRAVFDLPGSSASPASITARS